MRKESLVTTSPNPPDIFYLVIDHDGTVCSQSKGKKNVEDYIIQLFKTFPTSKFYFLVGSFRNFLSTDAYNWDRNHNGSAFKNMHDFFLALQKQFPKHEIFLDDLLMEDLQYNAPKGSTFQTALPIIEENYSEKAASARYVEHAQQTAAPKWFDPLKRHLIYLQAQHIVQKHGVHQKIGFCFFDDRKDIHVALDVFFQDHPFFLPENITLFLLHVEKNSQLSLFGKKNIRGEGGVGPTFCFSTPSFYFEKDVSEPKFPNIEFFFTAYLNFFEKSPAEALFTKKVFEWLLTHRFSENIHSRFFNITVEQCSSQISRAEALHDFFFSIKNFSKNTALIALSLMNVFFSKTQPFHVLTEGMFNRWNSLCLFILSDFDKRDLDLLERSKFSFALLAPAMRFEYCTIILFYILHQNYHRQSELQKMLYQTLFSLFPFFESPAFKAFSDSKCVFPDNGFSLVREIYRTVILLFHPLSPDEFLYGEAFQVFFERYLDALNIKYKCNKESYKIYVDNKNLAVPLEAFAKPKKEIVRLSPLERKKENNRLSMVAEIKDHLSSTKTMPNHHAEARVVVFHPLLLALLYTSKINQRELFHHWLSLFFSPLRMPVEKVLLAAMVGGKVKAFNRFRLYPNVTENDSKFADNFFVAKLLGANRAY